MTILSRTETRKARTIDEFFEAADFYSDVPFVPFGHDLVDVCVNHTGERNLWVRSGAALSEIEGGGKNVMGCDAGALHCNVRVTPERVSQMVRAFREGRAPMNGLGPPQITWFPYVRRAMLMPGGAASMRNQMIVGFNVLNDLLNSYPFHTAVEAYNDGNPEWNDPANPYEQKFAAALARWEERLA